MDEGRRLAYLEALGVPLYYPRRALPGAAASRRLPLLRAAGKAADRPGQGQAERESVSPAVAGEATPAPAPARREKPDIASDAGGRRSAVAAPASPASPVSRRAPARGSAIPRFNLARIRIGSLLILDDPASPRDERDRNLLLWHVALAMGALPPASGEARPGGDSVRVDAFAWPLARPGHSGFDQSLEAARATLGHFIESRVEQDGLRSLLAFGESAGTLLQGLDCKGLRQWQLPFAASAMLGEPTLKAQLWNLLCR